MAPSGFHKKPELPKELVQRLGGDQTSKTSAGSRRKPTQLSRKDRRKADREQQKIRQRHTQQSAGKSQHIKAVGSGGFDRPSQPKGQSLPPVSNRDASQAIKIRHGEEKSRVVARSQRARPPSPPLSDSLDSLPPVSRKEKLALDRDDAEIAALEKKLGLKKGRRLPQAFDEDGLSGLLDDIDGVAEEGGAKRKRGEYEEFLKTKRRKSEHTGDRRQSSTLDADVDSKLSSDDESSRSGRDDSTLDLSDDERTDEDVDSDDSSQESLIGERDLDTGSDFAEDDGDIQSSRMTREVRPVKENPYRPPVAVSSTTARYVPPSQRAAPASDSELLARLRRQLQGLLNRLSEANLISILKEVENVLGTNARQYVIESLIDLLMGLLCDRTMLTDTFIILHAGFIAAVYKVIGPHFGAQFLERLVREFDTQYDAQKANHTANKQASNLIGLLAELYTFQVVGNPLIFDYLRLLLGELSDLNTELLLKLIRNCGTQLRQDDPTALKDIVTLLQKAVVHAGGETKLPVRTRFMIETINDLKNNRLKAGAAASQVASEHVTRMKKTLGTLNTRSLQPTEPLGVGLSDISNVNKEGKWWLVGASWRNSETQAAIPGARENASRLQPGERPALDMPDLIMEEDLIALAKSMRINTDIRRLIFITLMSSTDYKDCSERLTRLRLKRSQMAEISRVLLLCVGGEGTYNPYYGLVAKRVCSSVREVKMGLQFGLWDLFKRMGERANLHEEDDQVVPEADDDEAETGGRRGLRTSFSQARFFADLIAAGAMSITALKVLSFTYLQLKTALFMESLLVFLIQHCSAGSKKKCDPQKREAIARSNIIKVFEDVSHAPQMGRGLQWFLETVVRGSELAIVGVSAEESDRFTGNCDVAVATVEAAMMSRNAQTEGLGPEHDNDGFSSDGA